MKVKYLFYCLYIIIILIVPCSFFISAYETSSIEIANNFKPLVSEKIGVNSVSAVQANEESVTTADASSLNIEKKEFSIDSITDSLIPAINVADAKYSDILETRVGKLTAYGPDCPGCSGRVGWGQNVTGGNIYYNDATYGQLRIVAGDKKYPYGTIVRIKNSRAGSDIMAIVLDRGGSVGIGKATMFDLLFASGSEASSFGTSNNCTFEILRYGF